MPLIRRTQAETGESMSLRLAWSTKKPKGKKEEKDTCPHRRAALIASTCMGSSQLCRTSVPGNQPPSSDLRKHQAYMWCRNKPAKPHTHKSLKRRHYNGQQKISIQKHKGSKGGIALLRCSALPSGCDQGSFLFFSFLFENQAHPRKETKQNHPFTIECLGSW